MTYKKLLEHTVEYILEALGSGFPSWLLYIITSLRQLPALSPGHKVLQFN